MNRRESIGMFSAALAAPALLQAAGAAATTRDAPLDPLHTHVRQRARPDGKAVYFAYEGTFYGQRSGQRTVALLHIEGASASNTALQPDGSWLFSLREAGWFCDLGTREVLTTWVNPLNGRSVTPGHYNSRQQLRFSATGVAPAASALPPGLEWQGQLTTPVVMGDDVWSAEELFVRVPPKSPDDIANVQTSLATLHSRLADLQRPDSAWVPATLAYQTLASWRPWMQMAADMPGVMSWRLFGRKCASIDELPVALRQRVQAQHPEVLQL